MELIEVTELVRGRDGQTAVVAHSDTGLDRGLEIGEAVVLSEGSEFRAAKVRNLEFEPEDTYYTFELGGRLPEDLAQERVAGLGPMTDVRLHEVVDLLGDLRQSGPPDPGGSLGRQRPLTHV